MIDDWRCWRPAVQLVHGCRHWTKNQNRRTFFNLVEGYFCWQVNSHQVRIILRHPHTDSLTNTHSRTVTITFLRFDLWCERVIKLTPPTVGIVSVLGIIRWGYFVHGYCEVVQLIGITTDMTPLDWKCNYMYARKIERKRDHSIRRAIDPARCWTLN